jgi:arginine decarboxylase
MSHIMVPKEIFLTKGVGRHKHKLESFELALKDAGIEKQNLVMVSSIFPPQCKVISRQKGMKQLLPGQITFCVMSRNSTNEPNRLIAASIGLAIPSDNKTHYGYLSEHHSFGETEGKAGEYAEDMAACMLAATLGIEFDEEKNWDDRKELWRMDGRIVKTRNISQSALGDKKGLWTTVLSTAVFIL